MLGKDCLENWAGMRFEKNATDLGLWFSLDLNKLIEGIYVNPESPEWVLSLVKSVLNLYGFKDINVLKSKLGADPIW